MKCFKITAVVRMPDRTVGKLLRHVRNEYDRSPNVSAAEAGGPEKWLTGREAIKDVLDALAELAYSGLEPLDGIEVVETCVVPTTFEPGTLSITE